MKIDLEIKSKGDPNLVKTISLKVVLATRTKVLITALQTDLDSSFEIPVLIQEVENLYGFGFTLNYDKEYLDFEDVIEGEFLKKDGVSTLFLKKCK